MILPVVPELAYIGPGAGFAFLGSFLTILGGLFLGVVSLLMWPFRRMWAALRGVQGYKNARIRKLIFLGLDGFDPGLAERYMAEGKLPNLRRLKEQGGFSRLRTTFPALSPVAWSTFATGVNPARHNMFDFLNRSLRSYMPELSSSRVTEPLRTLKIGKYRLPLGRPVVELRRKSRTFWQILGERHIASTILRVPITFPPEKFHGRMLSAMCTPDLLGTQGTFALHTTRRASGAMESGNRFPLQLENGVYRGEIEGPRNYMEDGGGSLRIPFTLTRTPPNRATFEIGGERYDLLQGEYTPWITLEFSAPLGIKVKGIARFLLTECHPELSLYSTPINIDPENPALPISHPSYYAAYLAKLLGAYATLGMAEDTWALNEHAIDSDAFLKQAYLTFHERRAMFLSALERTRRGVVACVFDTTDRVQHMFFAQKDRGGPYGKTIEDLYTRADQLVGETLRHVDQDTVLMVLSDHGFTSFERGVDLNAWLLANGYLALKPGATGESQYLKDVDWTRTRAYTFGLAGVYLNLKGRESGGIVEPSEAAALKRELAAKLTGLRDPGRHHRIGIAKAWPSDALYQGPYLDAAPDLIVGFAEGYRASWDAAVGKTGLATFTDNRKAWSGDHCVDPRLVPGVLFCNRAIDAENPGIEDMAPTALDLFGISPPPYMEGKPLLNLPGARALVRAASTLVSTLLAAVLLLSACSHPATHAAGKRMIVLGVDGMDPVFVARHWNSLPNLSRLRSEGSFLPLATSVPPQSPVAWSSVTTGMDPGGHGTFDFVHRDPATRMPISSMAEASEPGRTLSIGPYLIPLTGGTLRARRAGRAFWQILAEAGVPSSVIRMPANFPPAECEAESLAGMGTPDLVGSFGTFTFYTDDPSEKRTEVPGGRIVYTPVRQGRATLPIQGPANPLRKDHAITRIDLTAHVDPEADAVRFDRADQRFILRVGDWSGWVRIEFPFIGGWKTTTGMVRLYLQQAHPYLRVYISPVNLDPESPALPISTPENFSRRLAESLGPYYTQGIAEETSAFRAGLFSRQEFLTQSRKVLADSLRMFRYELDRFQDGLLFYYFSSVDQNAHMLWGKYDDDLLDVYKAVDSAIGDAMRKAGRDTTLLVLSDHGFARFDRAVHLNAFLMREGFLVLDDPIHAGDEELFAHVDWSRTQAYAIGLNAIYLNLQGREKGGIVQTDERRQVAEKIAARLKQFRDPASGQPVVGEVYFPETEFRGRNLKYAPDLLVGFHRGFRASWQTALGAVPKTIVEDNTQAWIGDHCMAASEVPGVLFGNRKFRAASPRLVDITATILREFGVPLAPGMIGEAVY